MNTNEKSETGAGINDFVQKHRKPIFISAAVIAVLLVICIAALSLMDFLQARAISAVEDFGDRYETLRPSITAADTNTVDTTDDTNTSDTTITDSTTVDNTAVSPAAADGTAEDVDTLLAEVEAFAKKNSGYAGGRAWSIAAGIYSDRKEWPQAETAWTSAAAAAGKTYMAPLAWFNAAAAAEEQGKTAEAISHYENSLATPEGFAAAPRAQFAIGRLREALNETPEAIEAYRAVISKWPQDAVWNNLAHSRVIELESK